jgi:hypothetical protein
MALGTALIVLAGLSVVTVCLQHLKSVRDRDVIAGLRREVETLRGLIVYEAIVSEKRHVETCWQLQEDKRS